MLLDVKDINKDTCLYVNNDINSELIQITLVPFKNTLGNNTNNQLTQEDYKTIQIKKRTIHPTELEDPNAILIGIDQNGFLTSDEVKIVELLEVLH